MDENAKEFFKSLRELCDKHQVWIGVTNDPHHSVSFTTGVAGNPKYFNMGRVCFDGYTNRVYDSSHKELEF